MCCEVLCSHKLSVRDGHPTSTCHPDNHPMLSFPSCPYYTEVQRSNSFLKKCKTFLSWCHSSKVGSAGRGRIEDIPDGIGDGCNLSSFKNKFTKAYKGKFPCSHTTVWVTFMFYWYYHWKLHPWHMCVRVYNYITMKIKMASKLATLYRQLKDTITPMKAVFVSLPPVKQVVHLYNFPLLMETKTLPIYLLY